jgi:hypothetical protein
VNRIDRKESHGDEGQEHEEEHGEEAAAEDAEGEASGEKGQEIATHPARVVVGALERVRYQTHVSRPDDIVVCGRGLFRWRRSTFRFELIRALSARDRTVVLRPDVAQPPSALGRSLVESAKATDRR